MEIGRLNRRIVIERPTLTQDDTGAYTTVWTQIASPWADIRYVSGLEAVRSDAPVSISKASMRIRRRAGVDATCRVLYDGKVFDVKAVLPDEQGREFIDLVCESGQNAG